MSLTILAAISENGVIGIENRIPWRIREDMQRFKELTLNHSVIMGRVTYDSLPERFRPLPQRKNIVLSLSMPQSEGIYVARNIEEALDLAEQNAYVIGGRKIYELFLPHSDRMEITRVHQNFSGDAFFPYVDWNEWILTNRKDGTSEDGIPYSFLSYSREK
ncbi:MAG TPA: dihydrofolate reductase [Candidatus Nanoarchaeia archaeon]|nr:dihydrofolate reductase [Candidatus Nanoarchaeia archaeon]